MTSNAIQPLPFTPCTSDHSVQEASVGIFVSDPISNVEEYASYIRENAYLSQNLPNFKTIYKDGDEYSLSDEADSIQPENVVGFAIANLNEADDPIRFFQAFNEENRQYFSFHEHNYTRWAPFKITLIDILRSFHDFKSELKVDGLSLTYIDEYNWHAGEAIDYNKIFIKDNKYLPAVFFKEGNTDASLSTTMSLTKDAFKFHVRLSVQPMNVNEKQILRIVHNAVYTDLEWDFSYLTSNENTELPILLQAAHDLNKELLKDILLPQVVDLINMK